MAKLATQRAAFDVADDCLQIHGGAGYMIEYDIERAARDARLGPIGGGTDEIMKEILGQVAGSVGVPGEAVVRPTYTAARRQRRRRRPHRQGSPRRAASEGG